MIQLIYVISVTVESLLAFRAVFKLFGASDTQGIVALLYRITDPLVGPFLAIFRTGHIGGYLIEWSAIVALFAYGLAGFLLTELVRTLTIRRRG